MFWSLVRPDRILPPITRSAAVTTSLGADESAVGMITCQRSRRRLLEFDRLIKARISFGAAYFSPQNHAGANECGSFAHSSSFRVGEERNQDNEDNPNIDAAPFVQNVVVFEVL